MVLVGAMSASLADFSVKSGLLVELQQQVPAAGNESYQIGWRVSGDARR